MIDLNTQWQLQRDEQLADDARVENRSFIDRALYEVRTCLPGVIDSFDAATQTAQVRPAIHKVIFRDFEAGELMELPALVGVPVVALSGNGYALTFPIAAGDECLILCSDRPFGKWFQSGQPSEPDDMRHHSLSDAFALVGIRSSQTLISAYNPDALELRTEDGKTRIRLYQDGRVLLNQGNNQIEMAGGEIKLTAPTVRIEGQLTVSGIIHSDSDVTSRVSLNGHSHGGVYPGGSNTTPPL